MEQPERQTETSRPTDRQTDREENETANSVDIYFAGARHRNIARPSLVLRERPLDQQVREERDATQPQAFPTSRVVKQENISSADLCNHFADHSLNQMHNSNFTSIPSGHSAAEYGRFITQVGSVWRHFYLRISDTMDSLSVSLCLYVFWLCIR